MKVQIPLKGVSSSKVDIMVTSSTLKVNFAPYIVDVILDKEIDPIRHKATVKDGILNITLFKARSENWLAFEVEGNKEQLADMKQTAMEAQEALDQELTSQRKDKKVEDSRHATKSQMAIDQAERANVENLKQEEKLEAEKAVYATFAEMSYKEQEKTAASKEKTASKQSNPVHSHLKTKEESEKPKLITSTSDSSSDSKDIFDGSDTYNKSGDKIDYDALLADDIDVDDKDLLDILEEDNPEVEDDQEEEEEDVKYIPQPRSLGISHTSDSKVDIKFTPRVFPTPMRESKAAEEEDWVAKNRRHLKNHGVLGKTGGGDDVSEEDPVWLKAKGDDFFRSGDTHSAINAYSAAVDADPSMVACLSNRSACYLKLNMNLECRLDCDKAIELVHEELMAEEIAALEVDEESTINTPVFSNLNVMLLKLLVRRGVAQCNLGMFPEALSDYTQASSKFIRMNGAQMAKIANGEISPESLEKDIARLKLLHSADQLKRDADALFADGQVAEAADKYGEALALIPVYVSCLSNRSACKMALGDLIGCVEDCSAAVTLLQVDPTKSIAGSSSSKKTADKGLSGGQMNMLQTILPAAGSDKRKQWLVKTLSRRGVAFSKMEEINSSSNNSSGSGSGSNEEEEWNMDKAVQDFAQACAVDPTNESLKSDLNKLKSFREFKRTQALEEKKGSKGVVS